MELNSKEHLELMAKMDSLSDDEVKRFAFDEIGACATSFMGRVRELSTPKCSVMVMTVGVTLLVQMIAHIIELVESTRPGRGLGDTFQAEILEKIKRERKFQGEKVRESLSSLRTKH